MDRDIIFFVGAPGGGKTDARRWIYQELGEGFDYQFVHDGKHLVDIVTEDEHAEDEYGEYHFHPNPESGAFCITTTYPADEMRKRMMEEIEGVEKGKLILVELSGGIGDWYLEEKGDKEVDISFARMIEQGFFTEEILKRAIFVEIETRDKYRIRWNARREGQEPGKVDPRFTSFYVPQEAMDHLFAHDDFADEGSLKSYLESRGVPIVTVKNLGTKKEFEINSIEAARDIFRHLNEGSIQREQQGGWCREAGARRPECF